MSLFKKFFLQEPNLSQANQPVLTLLLNTWAPHELRQAFEATQPSSNASLTVEQCTDDYLLAELSFDEHRVELAAIGQKVPLEVLERTLGPSHWEAAFRQHAQAHTAHLLLQYAGVSTDPVEQFLALYLAMHAVPAAWQVAVLNEPGWSAHPVDFIPELAGEKADIARHSPPLIFWTGLLKLQSDDAYWLLTRGFHLFGQPDLAMPADRLEDAAAAQETLHAFFDYLYFEKPDVQAGDFIGLDEHRAFELMDGRELVELFGGPSGILILRPAATDEIAEHLANE